MTTASNINTMQDIMRLLDENPEWVGELRARLLSKELLETPDRLAKLTERTDALAAQVEALTRRTEALAAQVEALTRRTEALAAQVEALTRRTEALAAQVEALTRRTEAFMQKTEAFMAETNQRFEAIDARFNRIDASMKRIVDDLGILKGGHALSAAIRNAFLIASTMRLSWQRTLNAQEKFNLTGHVAIADIPPNELNSFIAADLIIEAKDAKGQVCYIAAEVSFTVNGRDTSRAIRNAELITRFTGHPARATVVGIRCDDRVSDAIANGEAYWYRLTDEQMQVE